MKTKVLGRTGIELPIVGIGTAFTGIPTPKDTLQKPESSHNAVDEELGVQTLVAALDAGCTFFDTAQLYNRTVSEKMIRLAFEQRPDLKEKCIVTTKVGRRHDGYDYSYDNIIRRVNESLERLDLEKLEIVFIHDAMGFPMDEVMGKNKALGALRHLQDQGIINYVGTAANNPDTNVEYIKTGEFDAAVIADSWSLINQVALKEVFPAAEKHNVGLVAATPIERGLLATGPIDNGAYLARNFSQACLDHVTIIQNLCKDYDILMIAVALQWCSRHPLVASTIPGARLPEEAKSSMESAQVDIPDAFWADLEPLIQHFDHVVAI
jgi:D-threo-aldose 1-dehydrogenase